jgi:hypothetical protein
MHAKCINIISTSPQRPRQEIVDAWKDFATRGPDPAASARKKSTRRSAANDRAQNSSIFRRCDLPAAVALNFCEIFATAGRPPTCSQCRCTSAHNSLGVIPPMPAPRITAIRDRSLDRDTPSRPRSCRQFPPRPDTPFRRIQRDLPAVDRTNPRSIDRGNPQLASPRRGEGQ